LEEFTLNLLTLEMPLEKKAPDTSLKDKSTQSETQSI